VVVTRVIAALMSAAVLIASGWLWVLVRQFNANVNRIDAITHSGQDVDGRDQNILLVGNDNRGGLTDAQLRDVGTTLDPGGGFSTDTILLVHLPADGSKATAVSFSRDLNVFIPLLGRKGKINSAYPNGACPKGCGPVLTKAQQRAGARALVDTVTQFSGLRIDHYVEVGLLGFYNITEVLGGVQICLNHAVNDPFSAIDLPAGRQTIKGRQAVAFVRQRHGLPNGAFSRVQRQQYFLGAVFRKLTSAGTLVDPLKQQRLVKAVAGSLTMDPDLNPLELARQMQNLTAGNLQFLTVPVTGVAKNDRGQDIDVPDDAALPAFWQKVLGHGPASGGGTAAGPAVPRAQVKVTVLNGTGTKGLASQTSRQLQNLGFAAGPTGNASRTGQTVIRYGGGQEAAARTLAAVVPTAQLQADQSVSAVTLVLGTDFSGLKSGGGADTGGSPVGGRPTSGSASSPAPPPRTAAQEDCID
jgi:LCP family protein required for cell wall assembly